MSTITITINVPNGTDFETLAKSVQKSLSRYEVLSITSDLPTPTKGDLIEAAIIAVVEAGKYRTRKAIAAEIGCTVSRVSEVLTAMLKSNDEARVAVRETYLAMTSAANTEAAALREAAKAEAKAEAKAATVATDEAVSA